ncbi:hypothetical protein MUK42_02396 [Musa troglodytarum]|uniref:RING-type domain-containing protein n=1 Tax=Musa troglodytarum TaxID=320322 RepID=A0A9E7EQ88_9LILI|nr:hypothetical protein MUK42_02396 [Musa troglodytarum]
MAVQARPPSDAFSPDLRNRGRAGKGALGDLQAMQDHLGLHAGLGLGKQPRRHHRQDIFNGATVFSDPRSELTCNASGSRKLAREESMAATVDNISGVRLLESGAASTSGRHAPSSQSASPLARDLVSLLYQQNLEIDALVRLESERLRAGMEETCERRCRALVSGLEQQVVKRLMEKEAELECANRRNAELEQQMRQVSEENRIWFAMAKNNEAVVCSLRTSLEQALLRSAAGERGEGQEGYGDSEAAKLPVDDAQSCCFGVEERVQRRTTTCRACGEKDVCVLLLPCKHLCLCKDCESKAHACPICGSSKEVSLQIFMC